MVWFKRKISAPVRPPEQTARDDRPIVRQVGREPAGVNPYDTAPGSARRRRGAVRDGAHVPRSLGNDPYGTADGEAHKRSWDDAFIDTWVERRREP